MPKRNYTIDFLRFFASTIVVLFHLNESISFLDNPYRNVVKLGWLGVPIFFVVSGYCIALAANSSKSAIDFAVRRFFRIFPMYWLSLLIVIICVLYHIFFYEHYSLVQLPKSPRSVTATILLLTSPVTPVPTINWVYWSLTVEIFFYIIIGLSLIFRERYRNLFIISVSIISLSPQLAELPGLFFLQQWPSFGLGLALHIIHTNKQKLLPVLILLINSANLLLFKHPDHYPLVSFLAFIVIASSIYWKDLPQNYLSKLGDYSYAVYLLHVPLGIYLLGNLKISTIQENIYLNVVYDVAIVIIILATAAFAYKYLELPGIHFGKKISKSLNKQKIDIQPEVVRV
jgi:peptidoglycan/LPS O-acetylase OafA/YrhL